MFYPDWMLGKMVIFSVWQTVIFYYDEDCVLIETTPAENISLHATEGFCAWFVAF